MLLVYCRLFTDCCTYVHKHQCINYDSRNYQYHLPATGYQRHQWVVLVLEHLLAASVLSDEVKAVSSCLSTRLTTRYITQAVKFNLHTAWY